MNKRNFWLFVLTLLLFTAITVSASNAPEGELITTQSGDALYVIPIKVHCQLYCR